jgi:histone-lysine N-methyltransferase SETMAR
MKMSAILEDCTTYEQRAVVRFLWARGLTAKDIHKEMLPVYGGKCLSRKAVHNWVDKFSQGRAKIVDEDRPGRPVQIATDTTVRRVEDIIRADRRVTIDNVAAAIGCSHGLAYSIMHDVLNFCKVCSRWVPRQLTEEDKMNRMGISLEHLSQYADEGEDMLNRIVTGDESWVHHYQPETKRASLQWKHPSSPSVKKFKVTPSAGKVMLTVFWDSQGVLLARFQKKGDNVNAASYCEVLLMLRDAIRKKRPGLLTRGVLLLHDNARPHTARLTRERIDQLGWKLLEHPAYSPDLAPSDYHLFGPLKTHLGGTHFADGEDVERAVRIWLRQQSKDFYGAGIGGLIKRWDKCINVHGDYVEK